MIAPQHHETAFAGDDRRTVGEARRWTRTVLTGAGLPDGLVDDALTCVSELATNATRYTASGRPGGKYQVVIEVTGRARAHVEVVDQGGPSTPAAGLGEGESGRGLWICEQLGVLCHAVVPSGGRRVWVDLPHPAQAVSALVNGVHFPDGGER